MRIVVVTLAVAAIGGLALAAIESDRRLAIGSAIVLGLSVVTLVARRGREPVAARALEEPPAPTRSRRSWPVVGLFLRTIAEIADTESSTQDRLLYVLVLCGLVLAVLASLLPMLLLAVIWTRAPELRPVVMALVVLVVLAAIAGPGGRVVIWGTRPLWHTKPHWWLGDIWRWRRR